MREEGNRSLTYQEMALQLADYVHDAGYTHVEFLPVMEHPFDGSRGNEVGPGAFPDAMMVAEESTAWPMVSRPTFLGALGFGLKWNMGWIHDTLEYMSKGPIYRKYYQNKLTFSRAYAFSENFVLPLSHDEVVYGKGSIVKKMLGDDWRKFANLRLLYDYMWGHPGKKSLFMGDDLANGTNGTTISAWIGICWSIRCMVAAVGSRSEYLL